MNFFVRCHPHLNDKQKYNRQYIKSRFSIVIVEFVLQNFFQLVILYEKTHRIEWLIRTYNRRIDRLRDLFMTGDL